MKKKLAMIMCTLILTFGTALNASAAVSPTGEPDTTPVEEETDTAPKTGEGNLFLYGAAAVLILSGTAVIAKKRLDDQNL